MERTVTIVDKLAVLRRRRVLVLVCMGLALLVVVIGAVALGAVYVPITTTARIILSRIPLLNRLVAVDWTSNLEAIILSVRLPRVILALLVGMGLALAGTIFQGLFRNPMADPSIIGSSQGAALGATIAFFFGINIGWGNLSAVPLFAFAGAILAVFLARKSVV